MITPFGASILLMFLAFLIPISIACLIDYAKMLIQKKRDKNYWKRYRR